MESKETFLPCVANVTSDASARSVASFARVTSVTSVASVTSAASVVSFVSVIPALPTLPTLPTLHGAAGCTPVRRRVPVPRHRDVVALRALRRAGPAIRLTLHAAARQPAMQVPGGAGATRNGVAYYTVRARSILLWRMAQALPPPCRGLALGSARSD